MLLLSWRDSQNFCDRIVQKRDFHLQLLLLEPPVGGMEPTACHKDMWFTVSRNTNDLQTPVLHSWAALPWKLWPKKTHKRNWFKDSRDKFVIYRLLGSIHCKFCVWMCRFSFQSVWAARMCCFFYNNFCTNVNNLEPKLTVQNQRRIPNLYHLQKYSLNILPRAIFKK